MYDLLIQNAIIVDGSGKKAFTGNVLIADGKIAAVGDVRGEAERVLDASGKVLAPGFIDSHGHNDITILFDPTNRYKLEQGVTTEVAGCCGETLYPVSADHYEEFNAPTMLVDANAYNGDFDPRSFTTGQAWFDYVRQKTLGTNMIMLVGQGALRSAVMGYQDREATPQELEQMKALLRGAMEAGASGLSTGIAYAPGVFTPESEIQALCEVVAEFDGYYSTHMRNQGVELLESVEETLRVTKATGVKTVISHLKSIGRPNWGKIKQVRERIDRAIYEEHLPVIWDAYPYVAGSTTLKITLPPSVLAGGDQELVKRVREEKWRTYIRQQIQNPTERWENAIGNNGFESIMVLSAPNTPEANAKTLQEYAEFLGCDPFDAYFDLIEKNMEGGDVKTINFVMCEEDLLEAIGCPYSLIGSDGMVFNDTMQVHPRGIGTFTRYLGRYVRDQKLLPMEQGIQKLTGLAADFYGLKTKGYIREGYDADLVLLDYDKVLDHADFKNCFQDNEGIEIVVLGGRIVVEHGKFNGACNGGVLTLGKKRG